MWYRFYQQLQGGRYVSKNCYKVFNPRTAVKRPNVDTLAIVHSPHVTMFQTHVHPTRLQLFAMRGSVLFFVSAAAYQFLTNLHTVPISGRTQVVVLTREEEQELGKEAYNNEIAKANLIGSGDYHRTCLAVANRLVGVANYLFPMGFEWSLALIDEPSIVNAACYPGGKIVVYTGLMNLVTYAVENGFCKNKHDTLATVLSHEIAHALARHTAEQMSYLPLDLLKKFISMESPLLQILFPYIMDLPFSRKQEAEADYIGLMLMASACYNPAEASQFWAAWSHAAQLADPDIDLEFDFDSTHPANKKRERYLTDYINEALELQSKSTWCADITKALEKSMTANKQQLAKRSSIGTLHEEESIKISQSIQLERERVSNGHNSA